MSLLEVCKNVFLSSVSVALLIFIVFPINESAAKHEIPTFDSEQFSNPLNIDNTYMPLHVGDIYVYRAETEDGIEEDTVEVTSNSQAFLDGNIECRAVSDIVTLTNDVLDHVPTEVTTDWYAQDDDGDVWYCGENTVEYIFDDEGQLVDTTSEGSWNMDEPGAEPGIVMLADPMSGDSYSQEYLEDVAEDMAEVMRLNAKVSVEFGDFDNCLETKEWTPLELGAIGNKYYYPGVGQVSETELGGGKTVESDLVDYIPSP